MDYLNKATDADFKFTSNLIHQINIYKAEVRKKRIQETYEVLKECKQLRNSNWKDTRGYSKDRTRRSSSKLPLWMLFDEEYGKYLSPQIPYEDRQKEYDKLLARLNREIGDFSLND